MTDQWRSLRRQFALSYQLSQYIFLTNKFFTIILVISLTYNKVTIKLQGLLLLPQEPTENNNYYFQLVSITLTENNNYYFQLVPMELTENNNYHFQLVLWNELKTIPVTFLVKEKSMIY